MKLRLALSGTCLVSLCSLGAPAWAQSAAPPPPPPDLTAPSGATTLTPVAPVAPAAPSPPVAVAPPPAPHKASTILEISSMADLRDRGLITEAEYESAVRDLGNTTGEKIAGEAPSLVLGKWSTTLYGFLETDFIHDTTQSFNDLAGDASVQRSTLTAFQKMNGVTDYGGNYGRTQFSIRNTRLGLRIRAPEIAKVRASGVLETDFLGYVPSPSYANDSPSESTYFASPSLRLRHAYLKLETPIVDVLVGQYWDLFGWQGIYQPNSVEIQGLPGELYSRDPQLRVSKTFASDKASLEIAIAARRPPSRDSQVPEMQGGLRFALPFWKGVVTNGATATSIMPFSIAVTGDYRHFAVPNMNLVPDSDIGLDTYGGAIDIFIPVIPAKHLGDHALSITAEGVTGSGMGDLYTGLTSGSYSTSTFAASGPSPVFPVIYNNTGLAFSPTYPQDVDNGLVDFCPIAKGVPASGCTGNAGSLVGIQWTTLIVGLQYYLPGVGGHVWVSGNVSYQHSNNTQDFARSTLPVTTANYYGSPSYAVRQSEIFADGNVFVQVIPAVRLGAEYAYFNDLYVDGVHGVNNRFQLSGWFIF